MTGRVVSNSDAARVRHAPRREFGSFRDPSGFLVWRDGEIFRVVTRYYQREFEHATASGLFQSAIDAGLMLPFRLSEVSAAELAPGSLEASDAVAVLKPDRVPMITYPYEWSFSQLKDAAATTLRLHLLALKHGMLLKDASAYNIQFVDGRARHIDHLSFDPVSAHPAWPAYGQFCRHFLAPLLLMSRVDLSLGRLSVAHLDGVPLDLASRLLPWRSRLSPSTQMHIHMHARASEKYAASRGLTGKSARRLSDRAFEAFATSLLETVERLKPLPQKTEWGAYYEDTNYSDAALDGKKALVRRFAERVAPRTIWDMGGNNGAFSRVVCDLARLVVCMDVDPRAVDENYRTCRQSKIGNILPMLVDLTNPSPAIGFANKERATLADRGQPDLVMALALIHHLAISNNLPLPYIAGYFASIAPALLIEFVPKSDSQVQRLLSSRPDIFPDYHETGFLDAFSSAFDVEKSQRIPGTERTLHLLRRRPAWLDTGAAGS
ncbi:MAG: SAM-dependent methyltransferase [Phycisphaerae bacterium]|nr:SAM-dependent methyltransferase [Phycisphaerae bacterium]